MVLDGDSEAIVGHCWGRVSLGTYRRGLSSAHVCEQVGHSSVRVLACFDVQFTSHAACASRSRHAPCGCQQV